MRVKAHMIGGPFDGETFRVDEHDDALLMSNEYTTRGALKSWTHVEHRTVPLKLNPSLKRYELDWYAGEYVVIER